MAIFALLIYLSIIHCQLYAISGLYFKFKGLIGLPKFLKFHIMVGFDDVTARESYVLDFLPIDAANPAVMAKIISGKSMPGEVRIMRTTFLDDSSKSDGSPIALKVDLNMIDEETRSAESGEKGKTYADMLTSDFNPSLNIYFNNCYNFAFHCYMKDKQLRNENPRMKNFL